MSKLAFTHTQTHTHPSLCTGGNQRELARQKNAKKQASQGKAKGAAEKGSNKGASLEQRKHRYIHVHLCIYVCINSVILKCLIIVYVHVATLLVANMCDNLFVFQRCRNYETETVKERCR